MIYASRGEDAEKKSVPEEMNPAVRLFCLLLLAVSYLLVNSHFGQLFAFAFLLALLYLSELPFGVVTSAVRRLFPLLGFVTLLNFCFFSPETAFFRRWVFAPSVKGAVRGIFISLKIVEIVTLFDVFNALMSPAELLSPLTLLFRPFSLLGIEPEQIAVTVSSAFTFLGLLKEKFDTVSKLQKKSGSEASSGKRRPSPGEKGKLLLPVLYEALTAARERAALFEARGVPEYMKAHAGLPKSFTLYDACALTVCIAFFAMQLIVFR